jgi:DNA-binding beta-propeller fold protein YncE
MNLVVIFLIVALLSVSFDIGPAGAQGTVNNNVLQRVNTLHIPGKPLESFDASIISANGGIYALADRSNHGIDLFDIRTDRFLGRVAGFTGFNRKQGGGAAGPNGMVAVGRRQIWASNGNSIVTIIDAQSHMVIGTVTTGGTMRVDDMAYDQHDHLVIAINNADKPPFLTFISTDDTHKVAGRVTLAHATGGLEQPVVDPAHNLVYVAVPEVDGVAAQGGIAVIDVRTRKLIRMIAVQECAPAGLAIGPDEHLLVGCSGDAVAAGFPAKSLVLDLRSGKVVSTIHQVGGSDEVWFDKQQDRYYLAAVANPGGPVLGVINARDDRWMANVPTGPHAHSVAADPVTGQVFVPIGATNSASQCQSGCIAVFAARSRR